jgi:hypothetical protein
MSTRQQYEKALSFWTSAFEYLMLVEFVARETVIQGNKHVIIDDGPISEEEYEERTKWSDHTLVVPLLFNLYHGIELLVKGFLLARGYEEPTHEIQKLCRLFADEYPDEKELNCFLNKYINETSLPPILGQFLIDNRLSFKSLYEALRYPDDRNFRNLKTYIGLKYKGEKGLQFFREL